MAKTKAKEKTKTKTKKERPTEPVVLVQKVVLDSEILAEINRHYSARLGDEVLGRECFSDPKLDSHICSVRAKVPGGDTCKTCGGIDGRPCTVTCHVHHYCLATYATRLGIGVTKKTTLVKWIKHNISELTYGELYDLVVSRKALLEVAKPEEVTEQTIKDRAQTDLNLPEPLPVEKRPVRPEVLIDKEVLEAEGLVTMKTAAEMCECSYMNIMGHVRRGNITKIEKDGAVFLKKEDVLQLKERMGKTQ
jgi:hypothetical protein